MDRRRLLVLGAASAIPACSAGGGDPAFFTEGGGLGGSNGVTGPATTTGVGTSSSTSSSGQGTSTSASSSSGDGTSTSTSSSSGSNTSTSSSSGSNTSTSSSTSASTSASSSTSTTSSTSSTGGTTCTAGSNSKLLTFAAYPQLSSSGGSVSFKGSGYSDSACGQPDIIVVAKGGGVFAAFSASCSHQCCTVSVSGTGFRCPCHGATFNSTGACTNGKAPLPLDVLQVCADSAGVTVTW